MPPADKLQALMTRFAGPPHISKPKQRSEKTSGKRVQKNLTIDESDAKRLAQLSKREKISQARLLCLALDAYEHCYGALDDQDIKP